MVKGVHDHMFRTFRNLGNPFVNSTPFDEWNFQIQSYQKEVVVDRKDNEFNRLFIYQESMKPTIMTIHPWHLHVKNTKLTYRKTKSKRPCIFVIGIMGFYLLEISSSFGNVLEFN